jgi:hypothetical protein
LAEGGGGKSREINKKRECWECSPHTEREGETHTHTTQRGSEERKKRREGEMKKTTEQR